MPEELQEPAQNVPQNASLQTDAQNLPNSETLHADDSPELLRWRADILLDEMMLGAVDIAAGRPDVRTSSGEEAGTAMPIGGDISGTAESDDGARAAPRPSTSPWLSDRSSRSETLAETSPWASEDLLDSDGSVGVSGFKRPAPLSDEVVLSVGQPEPFLRPPSASAAVSAQGAAPPDPRYGSTSGVAPWLEESGASPGQTQDRRSNLLPRESQFDVTSHLREIERLELEIEATLPVEHEWSIRSRHLLAKAAAILKSSPERSAEVDYYLQQVRAILERAQQTAQWSKVYVKRLMAYLIGWALLSVLGLVASLLYAEPLTGFLVGWLNTAEDGYLSQHIAGLSVTLFAGTLGASLGALRNMTRYRRLGRGYVDRKYSLRTLLLPLLAFVFGLLVYLLFGFVYSMAGINPLQTPLLRAIPALLAFVFGLVQESLYGTAA